MEWQPIGLTDPAQRGPHVLVAQNLLAHNPFGNFHPGALDGEAGPLFAESVHRAKWLLGYPKNELRPIFGPRVHAFLSGSHKLPPTYRARRRRRRHQQAADGGVRQRMVRILEWSVAHGAGMHYSQRRPIGPFQSTWRNQTAKLVSGPVPWFLEATDCSGSTISYAWVAGVKRDPGGFNFSGAGSSYSIAGSQKRLPRSAVQPGDLVVWPGHHVCIVEMVGDLSDDSIQVVTQGQERGPIQLSLAAEAAWHAEHHEGPWSFYSLTEARA